MLMSLYSPLHLKLTCPPSLISPVVLHYTLSSEFSASNLNVKLSFSSKDCSIVNINLRPRMIVTDLYNRSAGASDSNLADSITWVLTWLLPQMASLCLQVPITMVIMIESVFLHSNLSLCAMDHCSDTKVVATFGLVAVSVVILWSLARSLTITCGRNLCIDPSITLTKSSLLWFSRQLWFVGHQHPDSY